MKKTILFLLAIAYAYQAAACGTNCAYCSAGEGDATECGICESAVMSATGCTADATCDWSSTADRCDDCDFSAHVKAGTASTSYTGGTFTLSTDKKSLGTITASTDLECVACADMQWWDATNKECKTTTTVEGCSFYKSTEDGCSRCDDDKYLNEGACTAHTTVDGCEDYKTSEDGCQSCQAGKWMDGAECKDMTDNSDECVFAMVADTCMECNSGFRVHTGDKGCTATIEGCSEYESATACKTCSSRYTSSGDAGNVTCTAKAEIDNCVDYSWTEDPVQCDACDYGYKLNTAKTACEASITGCLEDDLIQVGDADYCTRCAGERWDTSYWASGRGDTGQECTKAAGTGGEGDGDSTSASLTKAIFGLISIALALTL